VTLVADIAIAARGEQLARHHVVDPDLERQPL